MFLFIYTLPAKCNILYIGSTKVQLGGPKPRSTGPDHTFACKTGSNSAILSAGKLLTASFTRIMNETLFHSSLQGNSNIGVGCVQLGV